MRHASSSMSCALEMSSNAHDMLEEAWRILKPEGELMLIVPNRRGVWAGPETTPFGHGRPYSRLQLERLLKETSFVAEHWRQALFMPPLRASLALRSATAVERIGEWLWPAFAGVYVVVARKQVYAGLPVENGARIPARLMPVPAALALQQPNLGEAFDILASMSDDMFAEGRNDPPPGEAAKLDC
jgi:SAM-dependent methyltransferase